MSLDKPQSIGIFCIIKRSDDKYLFVKHGYGMKKWSLPGGGLERGEFPSEAGVRETLEESGFGVKIKRFVGIFSLIKSDGIVLLYEADLVGGEYRVNGTEITECCFFSNEEAKKKNSERLLYDAQYSAMLWSEMPPRSDGLPHEGWLTVPPTSKP